MSLAAPETRPTPAPPATRKADAIADDLLRRIVRGEIAKGSTLPREEELALRYGVQRGAVREALRTLETRRLIRPVKRRGTVVLDPAASLSPEILRALLLPEGKRVDPRALREVLELRAILDTHMNALAAERRTDEDLAHLDAALERLAASFHEPRRYVQAMDELGLAVARATQNRLFEMLAHWHAQVAEDVQDLLFLVRFPTEPQLQGVRALVEAIRNKDVETARALTEAFHEWANPRLLEAVGGDVVVKKTDG